MLYWVQKGGAFHGDRCARRNFRRYQGLSDGELYPAGPERRHREARPWRREPERGGGHCKRGASADVCQPCGRHRRGRGRADEAAQPQGGYALYPSPHGRHGDMAGHL